MRSFWNFFYKTILALLLIGVVIPPLIWFIFRLIFSNKITTVEKVEPARVAIVFGAGLSRDGSPSPILRDRVATAVQLLKENKVEKLLLSGDNRFIEYNEPGAMQAYALELGAPADALVLDYAGRRTYDTCYRAKHIFKVDKAILVTQKYHLPRALFLCGQMQIQVIGVNSDLRNYSPRSYRLWVFREILATSAAVWDAWFTRPLPALGEPLPIFPNE